MNKSSQQPTATHPATLRKTQCTTKWDTPQDLDGYGKSPSWVSGKLRAGLSMKTMGKSCEINGNYVENVWKLWDITGFMGKL